jgi:protein-tyrosine phosphatase
MSGMTRVWERLFFGSLKDADALASSNPHGITTVITICSDEVGRRAKGVNYLHFPIDDSRPISARQFDAIIDAIGENIRWGTVLLHCIGGSSRSPIIAAAWMHVVGYKNIGSALEEIATLRPIDPSPVLFKSVKELL